MKEGVHLIHEGADRLAAQILQDYSSYAPTMLLYSRKPRNRVITETTHAMRRYESYFGILLLFGAIATAFLLVTSIPRGDVADRLGYTITLILADCELLR